MEKKIPTIAEFIVLVEQKKINLCHDHGFYGDTIEEVMPEYGKSLKGIAKKINPNSPVAMVDDIIDGVAWFYGYLIVFDDEYVPIALMHEYEQKNHGVMGDIVALPGKDSLSLYNKKTDEYKRIMY